MLNKTQKKHIQEVQLAAAMLKDKVADLLAIRDDLETELEGKTELVQDRLHEKYMWMESFLEYDFSNLESELEVFAGLEVE